MIRYAGRHILKQQLLPNAEKTIQLLEGTNGKDQIPHPKKKIRKDKGKWFKYLDDQRLYYPEYIFCIVVSLQRWTIQTSALPAG